MKRMLSMPLIDLKDDNLITEYMKIDSLLLKLKKPSKRWWVNVWMLKSMIEMKWFLLFILNSICDQKNGK